MSSGSACVVLGARPSSARQARQFVEEFAADEGASDTQQHLVALLTSELVTNAVKYGQSGTVTVVASSSEATLSVAVVDDTPEPPRVVRAATGAGGGRGMWLVDKLATRWGTDCLHAAGKAVWFTVDRHAPVPAAFA